MKEKSCEYCGQPCTGGNIHSHHIHHRASGGTDIPENIIDLCGGCHTKAHAGNIKLWEQIERVARRENKTPEEICAAINLLADKVLPHEYTVTAPGNPFEGRTLDVILQLYFNCEETAEDAMWAKATILTAAVDSGMRIKTVSSLFGCSPAAIRERVRTYRAFPEEHMRAKDKPFTVHRIASKTDNPGKWLDLACENDFSTRQMEDAIKAEGKDQIIKKDVLQEKAERAVRMIKEVMNEDCEASEWLRNELKNHLGSVAYNEKTNGDLHIEKAS